MTPLAIHLFGPPRIERNNDTVAVDTRKALALLAHLILTDKPQSRSTLAALLWPDYEESQARASLRRTLSVLHKALEGEGLSIRRDTIGMAVSPDLWIDVHVFLEHLAACKRHEHALGEDCEACQAHLIHAVQGYTDDFLAGFSVRESEPFEEWQFFQREDLRRRLADALTRLVVVNTQRGKHESAILYARRLLTLDRLHEPAHQALMLNYARSGQYAAALHQYRECVQTLERELGVAPLAATTRLYEAILRRQVQETQEEPARGITPTALPFLARGVNELAGIPAEIQAEIQALPQEPRPLVGRAAELQRLLNAYENASSSGFLAVISGEAGIGKTRLAEEFVATARQHSATIIETHSYASEAHLAYGQIIAALKYALALPGAATRVRSLADEWFIEVARLLPELKRIRPNLPPAPPLDSPGAQTRLFEGICQALNALTKGSTISSRGVLFVDDAHWTDGPSLDVLTYLLRRARAYPIFVLLCWRRQEAVQGQRLHTLLSEVRRSDPVTVVELDRLDLHATRELVRASISPSGVGYEALAQRLYEETEGVPVFIVEYLAAARHGSLSLESARWVMPGSVRDAVQAVLDALSETSWQTLSAAAIIGRSFEVDTLREASGRSEDETVVALDELSAQGLIREVRGDATPGTLAYDFRHDKVRTVVLDEVSLVRQRLLHRRIAMALVNRHPHNLEALAVQIADHFRAAGQDTEAARFYILAGERARTLYANAEALAHFETALALGSPEVATLNEAMGDLRTLLGTYREALRCYESAASAAPENTARLECKLSEVYARCGEWDLAESHLERALDIWGTAGPAAERAHAYARLSHVARRRGAAKRAKEFAGFALGLAHQANDAKALAEAHNLAGLLASGEGQLDEALQHLETSLALVEHLDDVGYRIAGLNNLSQLRAARGEHSESIRLAEEALALSNAQGDRHLEAALRNNLADRLRESGDLEMAVAELTRAVTIFAEIGADIGTLQPEVWKLTTW